jgi:acetyl-CoA carboxylase carboxyl transferase subunit alpha|tara:strand:+ start:7765 stop:8709 length:945 start_codon:yes stop_codon:yes gene_type:complete
MSNYYLDFEQPLKEIDQKILELEGDVGPQSEELSSLISEREDCLTNIHSKLTRWQKVQLARHPQRPLSLDYIKTLCPNFVELHGDRYYGDDSAIVCGLGSIDGVNVVLLGQQKGKNTKENIYRNFGMMRPEGYRKALRVMKLAEKFNLPVISLIDTPGAYPGIGAEERGQGEAIARNLFEMSSLKTPIIAVVIGEGASGGALGVGICDKMFMLENTWYSVISPEGCASILWRDASKAPEAADAMKVTPEDLVEMGICDEIIKEPVGGAHREFEKTVNTLKTSILLEIKKLESIDPEDFLDQRISRYEKMGKISD